MATVVAVGPEPLERADVVARGGARVELTDEAYQVMAVSRGYVEALASDQLPHVLDAPSATRLAYRPGIPLTWAVWRRGARVVPPPHSAGSAGLSTPRLDR